MKQRIITTTLAVVCFLAALGIMLYPLVSSYVNEKYRSEIQTEYEQQMAQVDDSHIQQALEQARAYNASIVPVSAGENAYSQEAILAAAQNYDAQLNITGTGIMGYVEIPALNISLPIYHGTGTDTLDRGIGHLLGSSLPVGGTSTHTILTGHSGMANQRLFSDLPQMEIGDIFYLRILGKVLAYQVDALNTVLPYDTTHLGITQGEDYCTLITCTPIGINSHRLLVRGTRIPYTEAEAEQQEEETIYIEEKASSWENQYMLGIWLALAVLLLIALVYLVYRILRRKRKGRKGGKYVRKKTKRSFPMDS